MVFPVYFTLQLLTLNNMKRQVSEQIRDLVRDLAGQVSPYMELMADLPKKRSMYIVGGSIPVIDANDDKALNNSATALFASIYNLLNRISSEHEKLEKAV